MALAIVKRPLSGSTEGRPIGGLLTATGSVIHVASSSTADADEVYLFAYCGNSQTTSVNLSLLINSQTYTVVIPVNAVEYPILSGHRILGNTTASDGHRIEAYVNTGTAALRLHGYVNRVTES